MKNKHRARSSQLLIISCINIKKKTPTLCVLLQALVFSTAPAKVKICLHALTGFLRVCKAPAGVGFRSLRVVALCFISFLRSAVFVEIRCTDTGVEDFCIFAFSSLVHFSEAESSNKACGVKGI